MVPNAAAPPVVEMRGIVKRFAGVLANDQIDLHLNAGEVLALLGENGAGKTTLMNILYGLLQRDAGEIALRGRPVNFHSARDAITHGLGMVHQHFMLVPSFTVTENLVLGQPSPRAPWLEDPRAVAGRLAALSDQYGLKVDPSAAVWQLSVGQQQRVEILKTLYRGAEVLILDEPTAVLTPPEVKELLAILRGLAGTGRSIIFISHKLDEVMAVADRIAVLRDGRLVGNVLPAATNAAELSRLMVGRPVGQQVKGQPAQPGEVRLAVRDLWVQDDRRLPALRGIGLDVRAGEIVGIAGVEGNGQRELEEVLSGLRPSHAGQVTLCGRDITRATPRQIFEAGLGYVPSDRYHTALLPDFSVAENLVLQTLDRAPYTRRGLLQPKPIRAHAQAQVRAYDIRVPSEQVPVGKLSGGNAQKVVLARELAHQPRLLLAAQPTRGLDVGAIEYVHQMLVRQRDAGMAILLISTELEEILALSDRILVLYEGQFAGDQPDAPADRHALGLLMAGAKPGTRPAGDA